ncbi:MAG: Ig-like domain-containing protein [bacterium]|nr:Ig-like domain-containing protein [bacterium]
MTKKLISAGVLVYMGLALAPMVHAAAPFIYNVTAKNIAGSFDKAPSTQLGTSQGKPGIELTWTTNTPSDSTAYYNTQNINSFGYSAGTRCDAHSTSSGQTGGSVTSHCVKATGLAGNTAYYFEIISCSDGQCGVQFISAKTGDGPPLYASPAAPSGLTLSLDGSTSFDNAQDKSLTTGGTSANLKWADNSGSESGFEIYRTDGGLWTSIATVPANVKNYSDKELPAGKYTYRVNSFTAFPGMPRAYSAPSNQVSITIVGAIEPTPPPSPEPGAPIPAVTGACLIRNHYTALPNLNAPDESTGYVKRAKPDVKDIASLRAACTATDFEALLKTYCTANYSPVNEQVATYDATGNVVRVECRTESCAEISCPITQAVIPDMIAPSAPELAASALSATTIRLQWNGASDNTGVIGYSVYRDGTNINKNVSALSYDDGPFSPGTTHSYFVRSYDAAGNYSPESEHVSVTTPLPIEHGAGSSTKVDTQTSIVEALPKISVVRTADVTGADVKITWMTEIPSESHIIWGTRSNSYPKSSEWRCDGEGFVKSHCVNMTGLTPETTYYYRAISSSPDGYVEYSPELTFQTPAAPKTGIMGGEASSPQTVSFVADTTPPRVTSFSVGPVNNGARAMFTVKFSKSVRPETLTTQNIFVYPSEYPNTRVPGMLIVRPNGFDLVTQNLPDADHILVVKNAVKDLAGNTLAQDYASIPVREHSPEQPSYTYPPVAEKIPLYVTGWVLNMDAVSKLSTMGVRFSTTLDPSSVNINNISIKNAGEVQGAGRAIAGTPAASGRGASFTPEAPLTPGRDYVGEVSANIKSAGGELLGTNFTCQFTAIAEGYYSSCPVGQATPPAPPIIEMPSPSPLIAIATITLTAIDTSNKSVPGASINITGASAASGLTEADGSFVFKLPPGKYKAEAFAATDKANALTKPAPIEFVLAKGDVKKATFTFGIAETAPKQIVGKVSLETRDALAHVQVNAYKAIRGEWVTAFTNTSGMYEMKMGGGDWTVDIAPHDAESVWHRTGTSKAVSFKNDLGAEKESVDFSVASVNAKITIRVIDQDQHPLKAAVILDSTSASGVTAPNAIHITRFGTSGTDGYITFDIPPGTYYIRGTLPSEQGLTNPFEREVHPRANTVSEMLLMFRRQNLAATALLLGNVKFDDGRMAQNAFVWGWSERGESLTSRTNDRGEFSLAGREGGTWHIGAALDVNGFNYTSGETITETGPSAKFVSLTLVKEAKEPLPPPARTESRANTTAVAESRGGAKVVVPPSSANASDTVSISIVPTVETQKSPGVRIVGTAYDITLKDSQGKDITQFKDGIEISLPYSDEELKRAGVTVYNLTPSYFDKNGTWVKIDSYVVDPVHHVIIIRVDHLTRFALVAPQDFTPPDPVTQIEVRLAGGGVVLTWKNPESDTHHVKIYRSESKEELGLLLDDFVVAATSLYVDEDTKIGATYYYSIAGLDAAGNESPLVTSEAIAIAKQAPTTPGAPPSPTAQLYRGMRGPRVWVLQQELEDLGFFPKEVGPTGYFGPITQFSVRSFQASRGLPPTGIVEASTTIELERALR